MPTSDEIRVAPAGWAPFRICVLADLEPGPEYALQGPRPTSCRQVTLSGFDRTLSQISPAFRLLAPDPLGGPELEVDVRFRQDGDLGLGGLLQCGPLLSFQDALRAVECPENRLGEQLYRIFGERAAQLVALLPTTNHVAMRSPTATTTGGPSLPHHDLLDGLLDLVDLPGTSAATKGQVGASSQICSAALASKVQHSLATVVDTLLSHPEFQRLTRAWRSVRTLCEATKDCPWIEIHVLTGVDSTGEAATSLQRLEPDLVLVEQPISACARDAERLSSLAEWAERGGTPVIATLGDDWLVSPSGHIDARSPTRAKLAQSASRLLDVVGARQSARWLSLCVNDICDQGPVTKRLVTPEGPIYEQAAASLLSYTFLPAGIAAARCCISELLQHGHPFPQTGSAECRMRSHSVRIVGSDGQDVAIGSRHLATPDDADELRRVGISCFVPTCNRDAVTPHAFPTAYRPKTASGDLGHPASTLGDQLFAGRFVRLVDRCRTAIQDGTPPAEAATALERQIEALFPNAPPSGPEIRVTTADDALSVEVHSHRYEGLQLRTIEATIPFA